MTPQVRRILLVEDDENLIEMVRLAFSAESGSGSSARKSADPSFGGGGGGEGETGFDLEVACNGKEAINKAEAWKPDLILMDVVMPEMNGYEAARALKGRPATKHIPIFFLTAKSLETDIQEGKQAGGDLYIVKPFSPFELMTVIQEYFQSHPTKS